MPDSEDFADMVVGTRFIGLINPVETETEF